MSHFSHIKTKIRNLESLQTALTDLKIDWKAGPREIRGYQGQTHLAEVVIEQDNGYDLGFAWNGQAYEFVADLQYWAQASSVDHFLNRITQRYAFQTVMQETAKQGFQVAQQEQATDGTIRLVLQRWGA